MSLTPPLRDQFLENRPPLKVWACPLLAWGKDCQHLTIVLCPPLGLLSLTEPEGVDAACRHRMKHIWEPSFNLDMG